MKNSQHIIMLFFMLVFIGMTTNSIYACTRVLWAQKGQPVLTGRNSDWPEKTGATLWSFPRGIERTGLTKENPLKWTSRYGSVSAVIWNSAMADGINEKGLVANVLYLPETKYGERDVQRPGISTSIWAQYYLDNFATVAEAIEATRKLNFQLQPVIIEEHGNKVESPLHLSLSDAAGDSAVIEILDGKTVIHHGKQCAVMTNSPTYDRQVILLKQYEGFGGNKSLPGTGISEDRFARASYYLAKLPKTPENEREAVTGMFSVMRSVATPFGVSVPDHPDIATTQWIAVADSTHCVYYFGFTDLFNVVWVDLKKLHLEKGASPMALNLLSKSELSGDVSREFRKAAPPEFLEAGQAVE